MRRARRVVVDFVNHPVCFWAEDSPLLCWVEDGLFHVLFRDGGFTDELGARSEIPPGKTFGFDLSHIIAVEYR